MYSLKRISIKKALELQRCELCETEIEKAKKDGKKYVYHLKSEWRFYSHFFFDLKSAEETVIKLHL